MKVNVEFESLQLKVIECLYQFNLICNLKIE